MTDIASAPRRPLVQRLAMGILGGALVAAGLFFIIGGVWLISLGGSWYFLISGVAFAASGGLIALGRRLGGWIFAGAFLFTLAWAVIDAGLAFWPLVSRLFAVSIAAVLVALIYPWLARATGRSRERLVAFAIAAVIGLGVVATGVSAFSPKGVIHATETAAAVQPVAPGRQQVNWAHWGNTTQGDRFAALDQITKTNVGQLKLAWTFHTGVIPASTGSGAEDQNTPLQIGDTVYVCTAYGKVFAVDADTGRQKWAYDPKGSAPNWQRCRGLGYFDQDAPVAGASPAVATPAVLPASASALPCRRRLFLPTVDARLIAIDAATGLLCPGFGTNGVVDLKVGMGEVKAGYYQQTSTPLVAGNRVIVGGRVADNFSTNEPPGVVRAYDVRSGDLVWAWDPGAPATTRLPPEGQTYTRGTPNVWSAMAYDAAAGLVYLPTGNATPDFWAGERTAEEETFSSAVVALDVRSGRVRWVFQMAHHDLWDFDIPAQPLLYDIPDGKGGVTPALAQVTKQGEIFLLNRLTGTPVAKVEERPVPQGNVAGERYSPTQPFSVGMPSIGNQTLKESDMWGATPFDQLICRIQFKSMRHDGVFTPPGLDHALQFPGSLGGMNWGAVSVDPTTSYMFVNDMRLGLANYLVPRARVPTSASGIEMGIVPMDGTPFGAMRQRFLSPLGIPCQKPPFGTMSAIDLRTQKLVWQVPVGTVKDTGPLGIKMGLPIPIGMPTLGGSLSTQSGLLFFSGSQDFYLRAYDSATGREIWKARLPVGSQSGPMTYVSPRTGRQYVLLTAGGARQSPDRGDFVLAYALPDRGR